MISTLDIYSDIYIRRFEGVHQKYSPDWKLILNGATVNDSGEQTASCAHYSLVIFAQSMSEKYLAKSGNWLIG